MERKKGKDKICLVPEQRGRSGKLHAPLTFALYRGDSAISYMEEVSWNLWREGWVSPSAKLKMIGKRKSLILPGIKPVIQPTPSHFTEIHPFKMHCFHSEMLAPCYLMFVATKMSWEQEFYTFYLCFNINTTTTPTNSICIRICDFGVNLKALHQNAHTAWQLLVCQTVL